ncbi:MAG TPA: acetyltransferase [Methylotenera sp.]|nr:acetyltransferase [Methylotenera sp.]
MRYFDVFNGDADGICALVQLRLAEPLESVLVTGVKRDIALLDQVTAKAGDKVTVLDISMQKNLPALNNLLAAGVEVLYADHHQSGEIPQYPNLKALIDLSPTTCTSLIVDNYLQQQFHLWAITAVFGDDMTSTALKLATQAGLSEAETDQLQQLGIYLNYNGYGGQLEDLFYHPATLYQHCVAYVSPLEFIAARQDIFSALEDGYQADMAAAKTTKVAYKSDTVGVFELPDEKWARRVSGVWGNELANQNPQRAHLILTPVDEQHYTVSIRAPLANRSGANTVASQFATGGGRAGAAGINLLPVNQMSDLISAMESQYA